MMSERKAKLKIEGLGWENEAETHDFEQARRLPYGRNVIVSVENRVVLSHEDFLRVAAEHRDKGVLRVKIMPVLVGG